MVKTVFIMLLGIIIVLGNQQPYHNPDCPVGMDYPYFMHFDDSLEKQAQWRELLFDPDTDNNGDIYLGGMHQTGANEKQKPLIGNFDSWKMRFKWIFSFTDSGIYDTPQNRYVCGLAQSEENDYIAVSVCYQAMFSFQKFPLVLYVLEKGSGAPVVDPIAFGEFDNIADQSEIRYEKQDLVFWTKADELTVYVKIKQDFVNSPKHSFYEKLKLNLAERKFEVVEQYYIDKDKNLEFTSGAYLQRGAQKFLILGGVQKQPADKTIMPFLLFPDYDLTNANQNKNMLKFSWLQYDPASYNYGGDNTIRLHNHNQLNSASDQHNQGNSCSLGDQTCAQYHSNYYFAPIEFVYQDLITTPTASNDLLYILNELVSPGLSSQFDGSYSRKYQFIRLETPNILQNFPESTFSHNLEVWEARPDPCHRNSKGDSTQLCHITGLKIQNSKLYFFQILHWSGANNIIHICYLERELDGGGDFYKMKQFTHQLGFNFYATEFWQNTSPLPQEYLQFSAKFRTITDSFSNVEGFIAGSYKNLINGSNQTPCGWPIQQNFKRKAFIDYLNLNWDGNSGQYLGYKCFPLQYCAQENEKVIKIGKLEFNIYQLDFTLDSLQWLKPKSKPVNHTKVNFRKYYFDFDQISHFSFDNNPNCFSDSDWWWQFGPPTPSMILKQQELKLQYDSTQVDQQTISFQIENFVDLTWGSDCLRQRVQVSFDESSLHKDDQYVSIYYYDHDKSQIIIRGGQDLPDSTTYEIDLKVMVLVQNTKTTEQTKYLTVQVQTDMQTQTQTEATIPTQTSEEVDCSEKITNEKRFYMVQYEKGQMFQFNFLLSDASQGLCEGFWRFEMRNINTDSLISEEINEDIPFIASFNHKTQVIFLNVPTSYEPILKFSLDIYNQISKDYFDSIFLTVNTFSASSLDIRQMQFYQIISQLNGKSFDLTQMNENFFYFGQIHPDLLVQLSVAPVNQAFTFDLETSKLFFDPFLLFQLVEQEGPQIFEILVTLIKDEQSKEKVLESEFQLKVPEVDFSVIANVYERLVIEGLNQELISRPKFESISISTTGQVVIRFSEDIFRREIQEINETTLLLKLVSQSDEIEPNSKNFRWKTIQMGSRELMLQLYFDYPLSISADGLDQLDLLIVTVKDYRKFQSTKEKLLIAYNSKVGNTIPPQFQNQFEADGVQAFTDTFEIGVKTVSGLSVLVQYGVAGSISEIWGMMNSLQLMAQLIHFELKIPQNVATFYQFIVDMSEFDFVDLTPIYNTLYGYIYELAENKELEVRLLQSKKKAKSNKNDEQDEDEIDEEDEQEDIFNDQIAPMLFSFTIFVCTAFTYLVIWLLSRFYQRAREWSESLHYFIFWNLILRFFMEGYLPLTLQYFQQIDKGFDWSTPLRIIFNVQSLLYFACFMFAPFAMFQYFRLKYGKYKEQSFEKRFGEVVGDLNNRNSSGAFYLLIFGYRRIIITFFIVFVVLRPYWQIMGLLLSSQTYVIIFGWIKPMRMPSLRKMEYFNEVCIMIAFYYMIIFSSFVPDPFIRYKIGYVLIAIVALNIVANLVYINSDKPVQIRRKCQRQKNKQNRLKLQKLTTQIQQSQKEEVKVKSQHISIDIQDSQIESEADNAPIEEQIKEIYELRRQILALESINELPQEESQSQWLSYQSENTNKQEISSLQISQETYRQTKVIKKEEIIPNKIDKRFSEPDIHPLQLQLKESELYQSDYQGNYNYIYLKQKNEVQPRAQPKDQNTQIGLIQTAEIVDEQPEIPFNQQMQEVFNQIKQELNQQISKLPDRKYRDEQKLEETVQKTQDFVRKLREDFPKSKENKGKPILNEEEQAIENQKLELHWRAKLEKIDKDLSTIEGRDALDKKVQEIKNSKGYKYPWLRKN